LKYEYFTSKSEQILGNSERGYPQFVHPLREIMQLLV